jgi:hypothetical protein
MAEITLTSKDGPVRIDARLVERHFVSPDDGMTIVETREPDFGVTQYSVKETWSEVDRMVIKHG